MELNINFYQVPHSATQVVTGKDLKAIMLQTGGNFIACGRLWDIKYKKLSPQVYKLYAKQTNV